MSFKFRVVNTAIMSVFLSGFMTLYVTWINLGLVDNFVTLWIKAWVMACPAAFVGVMLLAPMVIKITQKILKE